MGRSIDILVEDTLSDAVARALIAHSPSKHKAGTTYPVKKGYEATGGPNGYGYIQATLPAFNAAAATGKAYFALVDMDNRPCPAETISTWLKAKDRDPNLLVRIAVREVEAWLLADREGLAEYLSVAVKHIPTSPESLDDPKAAIVGLAGMSRKQDIRMDMVPAANSRGQIGPYFNQTLSNFAKTVWDIEVARQFSPSLHRAALAVDSLN
jgi:hypothetical protein